MPMSLPRVQASLRANVATRRTLIGVDSEPVIADLDDNPFVPLSLQATLSSTLKALGAAVKA